MRHALLATAALVALSLPAAGGQPLVRIIGIGGMSYPIWTADESSRSEGDAWILGFWSGANMARSLAVGSSTDGAGIIARVLDTCRDDPSLLLVHAAIKVYSALRQEGR